MLKMSGLAVALLASLHLLSSTIIIVIPNPQRYSLTVGPGGVAVEYEAKPEKEKSRQWAPDAVLHKQHRTFS